MPKRIDLPLDELRHLYEVEKRSSPWLAAHFGVTTTAIFANLRRYGIPTRGISEGVSLWASSLSPEERKRMSAKGMAAAAEVVMGSLKAPGRRPSPDDLSRLYHSELKSPSEIAAIYDTTESAIHSAMKKHGVKFRSNREAQLLHSSVPRDRSKAIEGTKRAQTGKPKSKQMLIRKAAARAHLPPSAIELAFLTRFTELGYKATPQHPVDRYNIDIALTEHMIAVEIDPGKWHNTKPNRAKDERRDATLAALGWRTVRFFGNAINASNPRLVIVAAEMIEQAIESALLPRPAAQDTQATALLPSI